MTGKIHIKGEIGEKVTLESVEDDIALYPEATEFEVLIHSGGGSVDEGYAIGGLIDGLRAKGIKTVAMINSLCASIATYIACSCDTVEMGAHGDFMIHLPTGTLTGNAEDLRAGAARLDRIKSELIDKYLRKVAKKGVTRNDLVAMIEKETSMSPQEAAQLGFIDVVEPKMKIAAYLDPKKYKNMEKMTDEVKGMFAKFGEKLDKLVNSIKAKNVSLTLEDGTIINSTAEDPNAIVGSILTGPDGPLPPGEHKTADGIVLKVTEGGKCESAEPMVEDKDKMKKLEEENKTLKEQLAQKDTQVAETVKQVTAAAKAEFKNQADELKALKAEFDKIKNETFGDTKVIIDDPDKLKVSKEPKDPMLEAMARDLGKAYVSSRRF